MKKILNTIFLLCIILINLNVMVQAQENAEGAGPKARVKDKAVELLDTEGNVKERISLAEKWQIITKTVNYNGTTRQQKVKQLTSKLAKINANGKYFTIIEGVGDRASIDEKGNENLYYEVEITSKIRLYDEQGKLLFEKQLSEGRGGSDNVLISDNGEIVAVLTSGEGNNEPKYIIFVYDKKGNEILRIPTEEDLNITKEFNINHIEAISPSGQYLAISLRHGRGSSSIYPIITRFYNLLNKRYWDASNNYVVYEITNIGMAKIGSKKVSDQDEEMDLIKYIGD